MPSPGIVGAGAVFWVFRSCAWQVAETPTESVRVKISAMSRRLMRKSNSQTYV
jgi:hypothetical protein